MVHVNLIQGVDPSEGIKVCLSRVPCKNEQVLAVIDRGTVGLFSVNNVRHLAQYEGKKNDVVAHIYASFVGYEK